MSEQILNKILGAVKENQEIIDFLKDSMATKDDIRELKNEMIEHVDGFIALYQKHEVELVLI